MTNSLHQWIIPIHDAFLVGPMTATYTRELYASQINIIYDEREYILQEYFSSIGIDSKSAIAWTRVKALVREVENFSCKLSALK